MWKPILILSIKTPLRNTVTSKCRIPWLPWPLPGVPLPGLPFLQNQSKPGWHMTTNRPRSVPRPSVMDGRSVRRQPVCATHSGSPFNRPATGVAPLRSRTPTRFTAVLGCRRRDCSVVLTAPRPARLRR